MESGRKVGQWDMQGYSKSGTVDRYVVSKQTVLHSPNQTYKHALYSFHIQHKREGMNIMLLASLTGLLSVQNNKWEHPQHYWHNSTLRQLN